MSKQKKDTKILITSDWHLGYKQYGLNAREQVSYDAAHDVVNLARQHNVDAILNGGDILDVKRPNSLAVDVLKQIHHKLMEEGIPMFVVSGNHDKTKPHWIELIRREEDDQNTGGVKLLDSKSVTINGTLIQGIEELPREELKERISKLKPGILLTHISVREWIHFPSEKAFSLKEDMSTNLDFAVIGDTHVTELTEVGRKDKAGKFTVVSAGSTFMNKADEPDSKFAFVVTMAPDKAPMFQQIELAAEKVRRISINTEAELKGLKDISTKGYSIVYVTFDPNIPMCAQTISQWQNAQSAVVRYNPVANKGKANKKSKVVKDLSFEEIIDELTKDETVADLGKQLLNMNVSVVDVLDDFTTKALA